MRRIRTEHQCVTIFSSTIECSVAISVNILFDRIEFKNHTTRYAHEHHYAPFITQNLVNIIPLVLCTFS